MSLQSAVVAALVKLSEYREQRQMLFPSQGSLDWYLRENRKGLVDAGALLLHAGRWLVDVAKFDGYVIAAASAAARHQVEIA